MYVPVEISAANFARMGENPAPTMNGWSETGAGGAGTLGMQASSKAEAVDNMDGEEAETTDSKKKSIYE